MWIRVALDQDSLHYVEETGHTYIDGPHIKEFYFDESTAKQLEQDGFLVEMWNKMDALFDWGDCDFFSAEKCEAFKNWLEIRLSGNVSHGVREIYEVMREFAIEAINQHTGIYFDF